MCDLFALCASQHYTAATSLPLFAVRGRQNVHGWGIGFFRQQQPVVEKSGEKVYQDGRLHGSFQRLARVDECHAHPFVLDFWGQSWIFAHNGKAPAVEAYVSPYLPRLEAASDSARAFEFLRDYFREAEPRRPAVSFLQVFTAALRELLRRYPGEYNLLLTNGRFLWAFTNHRQLLLLKGSEKLEDALLLTTIEEGLSSENWQKLAAREGTRGKILLLAGGDLLLTADLES
jgi:predicted glutamine amidotransferase